ncbi:MAG: outer membrane protein assembly factor BamD [Rhizobiaceae bacterium]|nr:outer membrane protein assembly factor BamD [Rhizobiaceae bacterium]
MITISHIYKERAKGRAVTGLAVACALLLASCSTSEVTSSDFVDDIKPADVLYNQALANMDTGDLKEASKRLTELDQQHPYSEYSRKSLILSTFINYRQGKYSDAIGTGKRFIQLYPGHKDTAYAQYLIGMSYFRRMPHITRDQTVTGNAYNAMNTLVQNYPDSEYVEDAKTKMRVTLDQLAGKEMLVGRYYQERREFLAAINRFRKVIERMQTTRHVEEALARLTECYYSIGLAGEAQTAAAILGHNYPESQWYKDSFALLQKGGLEPKENTGSWLSRAGRKIKKTS